MIVHDALGGRRIDLFIPFEAKVGDEVVRIATISFGPWKLDYTFGWKAGRWPSILKLMVALSEHKDEQIIRELREPDATRVLNAFMDLLPEDIRVDLRDGIIPVKPPEDEEEPVVQEPPADEPAIEEPPPMATDGIGLELDEQPQKTLRIA
jgi:hypothetical protein